MQTFDLFSNIFYPAYDGEPSPTPTPTPPENTPGTPKAYTEEEVKAMVENEKKLVEQKFKKDVENQVKALEDIKKNANLTKQEKENLEKQISELQKTIVTKEELTNRELSTLRKQHDEMLRAERENSQKWRERFTDSTITTAIISEAVKNEAYNPDQIVTLLRGRTELVEDTDDQGNGLGIFNPKVNFVENKDGKVSTLKVTVAEALNLMKQDAPSYGNLFKSGISGGLGMSGSAGSSKKPNFDKMSPEEYKKHRQEIMKGK